MQVTNRRIGWSAEGEPVAAIAIGVEPTLLEMATFFNLAPGDRHFASNAQASRYLRVVLMRPSGGFVIVPITPDVHVK